MITIVIALFAIGFVAATALGTQAYFRGEQSKPIHERNWRSGSFENLARFITNREIDYKERVPAYSMDAFASRNMPE